MGFNSGFKGLNKTLLQSSISLHFCREFCTSSLRPGCTCLFSVHIAPSLPNACRFSDVEADYITLLSTTTGSSLRIKLCRLPLPLSYLPFLHFPLILLLGLFLHLLYEYSFLSSSFCSTASLSLVASTSEVRSFPLFSFVPKPVFSC